MIAGYTTGATLVDVLILAIGIAVIAALRNVKSKIIPLYVAVGVVVVFFLNIAIRDRIVGDSGGFQLFLVLAAVLLALAMPIARSLRRMMDQR